MERFFVVEQLKNIVGSTQQKEAIAVTSVPMADGRQ